MARKVPLISQLEMNEYKRKYQIELQEVYDILRTQTEISKLAKAAQGHSLDQNMYPYIGDAPHK